MPLPPAENQASPRPLRTVLLASDNKNSILAELAGGKPNPIAYSAYGQQSAQQEVATCLGFNGELRETQIGWYLLGNGYRAYNPKLMRFHSPDSWSPFGAGGLNTYMYCVGDPVNFSDPTGHSIGGVISDFYSRKLSFTGRSQKSITDRHNSSITAGTKQQEAMYALKQSGGSPPPAAASSQSSGLGKIGALILGAPGPRGNNNPAIGNIGSTTARHYGGYETAAQIGGLGGGTALGNSSIAQTTSQFSNLQTGTFNPSKQKLGMHRDSNGKIWVTYRDSSGQMVTTPRKPVRGGSDATGTRPRTGMNNEQSAEQAFSEGARQAAFVAALDDLNAQLRQAGRSQQSINRILRREAPAIGRRVNAAFE